MSEFPPVVPPTPIWGYRLLSCSCYMGKTLYPFSLDNRKSNCLSFTAIQFNFFVVNDSFLAGSLSPVFAICTAILYPDEKKVYLTCPHC